MSETKVRIIKFIINAIKDTQLTLDNLEYLSDEKYTDVARGIVRGLSASIQRVAEQFDGHPDDKLHGYCAWATFIIMRDFERRDVDESIAKALKNFEDKLYVEQGILDQEESGTEVAEAREGIHND
jgi:hypothetical protein